MAYRNSVTSGTVWRCNMFGASGDGSILLDSLPVQLTEAEKVDLALRLNVLAVCAAIVFVAAILFGAF